MRTYGTTGAEDDEPVATSYHYGGTMSPVMHEDDDDGGVVVIAKPRMSLAKKATYGMVAAAVCFGVALTASPSRLSYRSSSSSNRSPVMFTKPHLELSSAGANAHAAPVASSDKSSSRKRNTAKSATSVPRRTSNKDTTASSTSSKPNIIVFIADDLGIGDVFADDSNDDITPNLSALLNESIHLTNFYAQQISTPTRAAFLTGKYPLRMGVQHGSIGATETWHMPTDVSTLAEVLTGEGYKTALMGKWHLGHAADAYTPMNRGFQEYFGYLTGEVERFTHSVIGQCDSSDACYYDLQRHGVTEDDTTTFMTTMISRNAKNLIKEHAALNEEFGEDSPLFMVVSYPNVHYPIKVAREQLEDPRVLAAPTECRRRYLADLITLDHSVSQVMDTLGDQGMLEDSVVFFFSDNGAEVELECGSNQPFRGKKDTLFQGGVKVPAFVYAPAFMDQSLKGTSYAGQFHVTDVFTTILNGILGLGYDTTDIDGVNQWSAMTSTSAATTEYPRTTTVINIDSYASTDSPEAAILYNDWKLVINTQSYGWWRPDEVNDYETEEGGSTTVTNFLFDLSSDPYEQTNLYDTYPAIASELTSKLYAYYESDYYVAPACCEAATDTDEVYSVWKEHDMHVWPWQDTTTTTTTTTTKKTSTDDAPQSTGSDGSQQQEGGEDQQQQPPSDTTSTTRKTSTDDAPEGSESQPAGGDQQQQPPSVTSSTTSKKMIKKTSTDEDAPQGGEDTQPPADQGQQQQQEGESGTTTTTTAKTQNKVMAKKTHADEDTQPPAEQQGQQQQQGQEGESGTTTTAKKQKVVMANKTHADEAGDQAPEGSQQQDGGDQSQQQASGDAPSTSSSSKNVKKANADDAPEGEAPQQQQQQQQPSGDAPSTSASKKVKKAHADDAAPQQQQQQGAEGEGDQQQPPSDTTSSTTTTKKTATDEDAPQGGDDTQPPQEGQQQQQQGSSEGSSGEVSTQKKVVARVVNPRAAAARAARTGAKRGMVKKTSLNGGSSDILYGPKDSKKGLDSTVSGEADIITSNKDESTPEQSEGSSPDAGAPQQQEQQGSGDGSDAQGASSRRSMRGGRRRFVRKHAVAHKKPSA